MADFVEDAQAIEPVFALEGDEVPVSVEGRRFQTRCVGTGDPAVVLVSGANTPQTTWHRVHGKVGAKTRICSFDRLGVGDSGPPPPVQTLEQLAADLDGIIDALALPRPLVVVGHSLGGAIAMVWATKHPGDTVGVVLIDASSAAADREYGKQVKEHYPDDVELNADPEQVDFSAVPAQLDALPRLGAVPLVVLTATLYQRFAPRRRGPARCGQRVRLSAASDLEPAVEQAPTTASPLRRLSAVAGSVHRRDRVWVGGFKVRGGRAARCRCRRGSLARR